MGEIWDKNPSKSEVIGRCGGNEKTRMTMQERQKLNAKKNTKKYMTTVLPNTARDTAHFLRMFTRLRVHCITLPPFLI